MHRVIKRIRGVFATVWGEECSLEEAIADLQAMQAGRQMLADHRAWMHERAAAELLAHGLASGDGRTYRCPMPGGCH